MKYQSGIAGLLFVALIFFIGMLFGRMLAYGEVSTECSRLKAFYVGNTTYHCEAEKK